MGITWVHMSLFPEALPGPRALTTQRKMGDHRLLGAQHSKNLKVGKGWEAEKGHPGNLWREGMQYLGHSPSHKSWALPEEPGTHICPGTTEPAVLGSLQLSPLLVIFSHLSICRQVPSFNHRVTDFHMRKTGSIIILTQSLLHLGFHIVVISTLPWRGRMTAPILQMRS